MLKACTTVVCVSYTTVLCAALRTDDIRIRAIQVPFRLTARYTFGSVPLSYYLAKSVYWLLRLQKTILSKIVFLSIITLKRSMICSDSEYQLLLLCSDSEYQRLLLCSDSEYQRLLLSLFRFGTSAVTLFLFV